MKIFLVCVSTILTVCLGQSTAELETQLQNVIDQTTLLKKKHELLTQLEQIDNQLGIYGNNDIQLKDDGKACTCSPDGEGKKENKQTVSKPVVSKELLKRREEIEQKKAEYEKTYKDAIKSIGAEVDNAKKQLEKDSKDGSSKLLEADKELIALYEQSLENAKSKLEEQGKIVKLINKAKSDSAETREQFQNERLILNSIAYERDRLEIQVKINEVETKRFDNIEGTNADGESALANANKEKNLDKLKGVKREYMQQEAIMLSKSPSTVGLVVGLLFAFIFVIGAMYFCINKKLLDDDQDQYYMEGGRKTSDDFYEKIL